MEFQEISILTQKGLEFPGDGGGILKTKNTKQSNKHRKLNWNFQSGGGDLRKNTLSVRDVWIISGTAQYIGLEETSAPYCWLMFCTVQQVRTI